MTAEPLALLLAELDRLNLLLHREVLRLRATYQLSLDEFRGLYIGDEQVDALMAHAPEHGCGPPFPDALTAQTEARRRANAARFRDLPWHRLAETFGLSETEQDLLLLALAPEIDLKYETIFAYLNNDVARRWPTHDLALRLLASTPAARRLLRPLLLPGGRLFETGLLQPVPPTTDRASWLAQGFAIAPLAAHYLLALPLYDPVLTPLDGVNPEFDEAAPPVPADVARALERLPRLLAPGASPPIIVLEGPPGSGRGDAARSICSDLGLPLFGLDLASAVAAETIAESIPRLRLRRRLEPMGVYLHGVERAFEADGRPTPEVSALVGALADQPGPLFLAVEPGTRWPELLSARRAFVVRFGDLDHAGRVRAWRAHLAAAGHAPTDSALDGLADRFALTPGQVRDVVAAAADAHAVFGAEDEPLPLETLFQAARAHADTALGQLALKVNTSLHAWDDLILPPPTLRHVKIVAAAVRAHRTVYDEWGFSARIAAGAGVKALFAGPSGTGKTMAAAVIARDLGLDLYRIDLSAVVSKYIGETEKNLDRVFRAARAGSAILFFDEADALFGKRSEVTDAHDRYANIEVAYLLQAIEEHRGLVILASNARKHLDEAFARRLQYVVEFPLPDEPRRERIWRGMFPATVPLAADVDLPFLARHFAIVGGEIKNAALDAAFLAAADGRVVTMRHLIAAMARQAIKQGRIPSAAEFKQYHAWIAQET